MVILRLPGCHQNPKWCSYVRRKNLHFLDIYIQRDIEAGTLSESEAQELIDHLVMKLRMVKFARIPSYNQLFSGDPIWATLEVAGLGQDGRSMVTKSDFRFLHTLEKYGSLSRA